MSKKTDEKNALETKPDEFIRPIPEPEPAREEKKDEPAKEKKPAAVEGAGEKQAGDGKPPQGQEEAEEKQEEQQAALVMPQAGQPVAAPDPRGDSPRQTAPMGFITHGQAGVNHPNQGVQPTRYAEEMTRWLGLSEAERAKTPPPEPPEGVKPHPLAVQPTPEDNPGQKLGLKEVILK